MTTFRPSGLPRVTYRSSLVIAFFLGAATVTGYAPFSLFLLPVVTLVLLFILWRGQPTPQHAAGTGFAFGLGLFLGGVSWIYVSLHDFGAMPMPLAAAATLLFCAYLALFPALAGYLVTRVPLRNGTGVRFAIFAPAVWTLLEWTRGWLFTGFPWLALGYSQVPAGPLAGYAPVLGIYGVTLATAASAGLIVALWARATAGNGNATADAKKVTAWRRVSSAVAHPSCLALAALWLGSSGLKQIDWTIPQGDPVPVSLLQGNVAQDLKWREDHVETTLKTYRALTEASDSRLIILPETALPLFLHDVPSGYLQALAAHARRNGGDILIGIPEKMRSGDYYNSVISLGRAPVQRYRKSHLVPFGEFIPLRPVLGWIVSVLAIPLQDFSRGGTDQQPLEVAGQRVAVNICYEDAFGVEIIRQLPQATLLVNVSNVAWFGRSIAPRQHLQISQARALETGRYMLRATNTGVTAIIDQRGRVVQSAPEFSTAAVTGPVQGYQGATPYVRWGDYAVFGLLLLLIAGAFQRPAGTPRI
ncbi:MAG: apolipoprotein N-acyltransferase [Burkholderiales bacterium]|nr:apolipoprotein N-acyltransferase [Burkholderiales bacterium]